MDVATSTSDELFSRINVDDFERPWTCKIRGFYWFLWSSAAAHTSRVNCNEMTGDRLTVCEQELLYAVARLVSISSNFLLLYLNAKYLHVFANRIMWCYQIRAVDRATLKLSQLFCLNDVCLNFLFRLGGTTKQRVTCMSIIIENFWPSVHKMLPSIFDLGQLFRTFGSKIFNDNLDVSHYLYSISLFFVVV